MLVPKNVFNLRLSNLKCNLMKKVILLFAAIWLTGFAQAQLPDGTAGTTMYDLQTHNSISKRYYVYPGGTIGTSWVMAFDEAGGWSDRGAGYNFFDGTAWGTVPVPKIQTIRCGGATYAPLGATGEVNISYYPTTGDDYDLMVSTRTVRGTGAWTEASLSGPGDYGIVYPNVVTSAPDNSYIHLLVHTYGTPYNGQENALLYYRSTDGGNTWDIQHHEFEELGASYLTNIDRETWSWAQPVGNTLAFSVGFNDENGYIMKSTDNGTTWQKIPVYDNGMSPYPGGEILPYGGGDGSSACALDAQGNAHVVFGRMVWTYDVNNTLFYFPQTEGLIYWREGMPLLDTTVISSYTLDYLEAGGNLVGTLLGDPTTIIGVQAYNSKSMTTYPQINIDGDNIFVIWSAIAPGFDNTVSNFRHICGRSSMDGGNTWDDITDYTSDIVHAYMECALPAMAPGFPGGNAHFCFWEDPEPGAGVWPSVHAPMENTLVSMVVPTGFVGIGEPSANFDGILEIHPNPFTSRGYIRVVPARPAHITLKIVNSPGQTVFSKDLGWVGKSGTITEIDCAGLAPGIYQCVVSDGEGMIAKKLVVE